MYHRNIGWVTAAVSLICVPCSRALAQGERLQIHVVETHSLELSELMRIGSLDGPSDAFGRIRAVALDRSDRLYVADDLNHEVRVFEFDGQLVRIIGREGEGPGEFRDPWGVAIDDADTLLVWDQNLARFSVFDPQGAFRRSFAPPRRWLVNTMRFLPGGDLLVAAFGYMDTWGLHRLDRDGELIAEFGTVPVDPNIYPGFVGSLFGGAADVIDDGGIVYTRKSPYELLFFDPRGRHMRTCVGSEDWTTPPIEVVENRGEQGIGLRWDQFVHSSRVFALDEGMFLNVVVDLPNNRTILDIVSADCKLLCRHTLNELLLVRDVRGNHIVATVESDIPEVIVFQFSVHMQE